MKTFVKAAGDAAKDPAGKKLMVELNKSWATALKAFKEYDKVVDVVEKVGQDILKSANSLSPRWLDDLQGMLNVANKQLKPIAAALTSFEKTEDALAKKYGIAKPAGGAD